MFMKINNGMMQTYKYTIGETNFGTTAVGTSLFDLRVIHLAAVTSSFFD